MILITNSESAAQAKYEIERALLGSNRLQLATGSSLLTTLEPGHYDFSVEWGRLIFAWWSEDHSQSWHVTAYEINQTELRLRAVRGLSRETALLTLRDPARPSARHQLRDLSVPERRNRYAELLASLITGHISGTRVLRVSAHPDRARLLASRYARLVIDLRGEIILAIGVSGREEQAEVDAIVAAGLVWLAGFNGRRTGAQQARRLWFCLPRLRSQTVVERLSLIDVSHLGARLECFEVDEEDEALNGIRLATQDELLNAHPRELCWPGQMAARGHWRERILALATGLIELRELPARDAESYSINGLEFARASGCDRARASFGVIKGTEREMLSRPAIRRLQERAGGGGTARLTEDNFSELEQLVREIATYRTAETPDRRHPFYRLRAEAWLESLLRRQIRALDATLDERFVYSQIPTWRADDRSVLDLLAINHQGRLVVIEIKAAEDINLPLQGLDYWLRVEQARLRGEFERRGLFPHLTLAAQSPLLYLVAPRLRFHRTFATVARCLASEVEAYRLGLNSNWRAGLRVHTCERVNGTVGSGQQAVGSG
jgi:hypothetical protein